MTASDNHQDSSGYQLYIYFGEEALPAVSDASLVSLHPTSIDEILPTLEASSLTAADLRTRTLFLAGSRDVEISAALYATLCGFAGRPLDFSDLDQVVEVRSVRTSLEALGDVVKPSSVEDYVLVGPGVGPDLLSSLELPDVTRLRYAKEALLVPFGGVRSTLEVLSVFSAVRAKGTAERLPRLLRVVDAPEAMGDAPDLAGLLERAVDLDGLRREGARLRRERRIDDRASVVDPLPADARRLRLLTAAMLPVGDVLHRLGSHENAETGFWRCPRPERHRNGDANPSAKIQDGLFRCFKCDAEYVDALRLVMDVHATSPDDAADWILTR